MDNSTLGEIGIGGTLLGGLFSTVGDIFKGEAQKQLFDYQAGVARLNSQIAQQNAEYARQVGDTQATRYGMQAAQRMGQIKVAQAASGLDVNSGSAKQVQDSQTMISRMDQTTIRSDAAKTAYNYETQAVQFGAQAQLDTMAGRNAQMSGMIDAGSSLLGTATSVDSMWLRGQQLGMWSGGK